MEKEHSEVLAGMVLLVVVDPRAKLSKHSVEQRTISEDGHQHQCFRQDRNHTRTTL